MKKLLPLLLATPLLFVACKKEAKVSSDNDKIFYSVGYLYGQNFKRFNLNENEQALLVQGVKEGLANAESQVKEPRKEAPKIRTIIQKKLAGNTKDEKAKGAKFLEAFVKNEGGKKTTSGLAYKIEKEGNGPKPKATDKVKVHYKGTLINGKEFDSSYKRGQPIEFPLNRVIKGWTEGVQLIGKGGKIKLVIPSDLGYKDQGAPPNIPGGATLVFEVELIDIVSSKK